MKILYKASTLRIHHIVEGDIVGRDFVAANGMRIHGMGPDLVIEDWDGPVPQGFEPGQWRKLRADSADVLPMDPRKFTEQHLQALYKGELSELASSLGIGGVDERDQKADMIAALLKGAGKWAA